MLRYTPWLLVLAACGRLGFDAEGRQAGDAGQDAPPPGPGPVSVTISVGGNPIASAYVVVVASDGATEILRTDTAGRAATTVTGATTLHIAYEVVPDVMAPEWAVRSFHEIGGGTDLVIGGTEAASSASMQLALPANGAATTYRVAGPLRCELGGESSTPMVTTQFDPTCQGAAVPVVAMSDDRWLDAGTIQLVPAGTASPTGTWLPATSRTVVVDVPTFVGGLASAVLYGGPDELELGGNEVETDGGPATVPIASAPFTVDRMQVTVVSEVAGPPTAQLAGRLAYLDAPAEVGGEISFDGSAFAPPIEHVAFAASTRTLAWGTAGTPSANTVATSLLLFEASSGAQVTWMSYAPGTTTQFELPVLPAPLDQLVPATAPQEMYGVILSRVDSWDYRELVSRIDRDLNLFTSAGPSELFPALALSIRLAPMVTARSQPRLVDVVAPRNARFERP